MSHKVPVPNPAETRARPRWTWFDWSMAVVIWLVFVVVIVPVGARPDTPGGTFGFDFRDTTWVPVKDLMAGHMPWDLAGYAQRHPTSQICPLYLPGYWILAMPLTFLPYWAALTAWLAVIAFAVTHLVRLCVHRVLALPSGSSGARGLATALALVLMITPPVKSGILATNWAVVCGIAAVTVLWGAGGGWLEVMLTGLAIVKPQVGLPLLVLQGLTRRHGVAWRAWGLSMLLSVPVGLLAIHNSGGLGKAFNYWLGTLAVGESIPLTSADSTRVDLVGTLGHMGIEPNGLVSLVLTVLMGVLTMGSAYLVWRRAGTHSPWFLLMAGCALLLVTPNMLYAVPVLIPGLVGVVWQLWHKTMIRSARWPAVAATTLAAVPFVTFQQIGALLGISQIALNTLNGLALNLAALLAALAALRATAHWAGEPPQSEDRDAG